MESDHFQQQSRKCFLNGRIVLHPPLRLLPTAVPIIQNREPLEDGNIPSRHGACSLLAPGHQLISWRGKQWWHDWFTSGSIKHIARLQSLDFRGAEPYWSEAGVHPFWSILGIQSNNIQCSMLPAQNMQYLWQFNSHPSEKGGWSSTTQLSTISGSIYVHLVPWWPIPLAWRMSLHCSRCWDTRLAENESPSPWEMGPAPTSRCLK